jgi:hypothetical protein
VNGYISLSQGDRGKTLQLGEFVTLEILFEEKIDLEGKKISLKTEAPRWVVSGSFTLDKSSIKSAAADGNATKLSLRAMVHQPGDLFTEAFEVEIEGSPYPVPMNRYESKSAAPEGIEKMQPEWFLPTKSIGGWNYPIIGGLALIALIGIFFLVRFLLNKFLLKRQIDCKSRALLALQSLQKFSRARSALKQEEWKKFSFELAGIMRKYSDENFEIDSADLTDREFLRELKTHAKNDSAVDSLAKILSTIDEVRYGKKELDLQIVPQLLLESRKFVEETYKKDMGSKKE